ncbi:DUF3939 domain-containing protein [Neobacillus sp. PS3-40]|uniref:DUF3939 domain-containing protein n=1 Tax=Neobacillus sp. PS3-40 TaxID=3070679 RepID=UPI0027E0D1BC|nr:DUF3939 domain-containing protein [Neobacillus sp. PS3-40]WML43251.1 DUF3939 domain-containing protein [Neobacillus sp. PS3-40]
MNQKISKHFNRMTESFEIGLEESSTYIHYTRGSIEKTVYALKSDEVTTESYFENFFEENNVSEEMRKDVRKFLKHKKNPNWDEFSSFLLKAITLHLVFGVTIALSVFVCYKLGTIIDNQFHLYPLFTVIGFFSGIGIGGLSTYTIGQKYSNPIKRMQMIAMRASTPLIKKTENLPIIDVTLEEVRQAVREFSDNLPNGVYRTILVQDDNSIDFKQLTHILGGIPSRSFYMSKETYELFEEGDKLIPFEMDLVQRAVDQYVKDKKEYPILLFDPYRKVSYNQLISQHYLKSPPKTQFYVSNSDGMITNHKLSKKTKGSSPQE